MSIKNESHRILMRGETANFKVTFYADPAQTIPVVPVDVNIYPAYTIYDPNNQNVQSGVGQPESSIGSYKAIFLVNQSLPLSHDLNRWRIEWTMVSTDLRQINFVEEFDVKDAVVSASESREQSSITMVGQDTRIKIRQSYEPEEVSLNVYRFGNTISINSASYPANIKQAIDGDSIIYYYDIPGAVLNMANQKYNIVWALRPTITEPLEFTYQLMQAITPDLLAMTTTIRMLLDKLQKRLGTTQAYEDSELVHYLEMGHQLVNSYGPPTNYPFGQTPPEFQVYIILMAGWYGLQAQQLMEIDLGFNFSGQTVTLDYDHSSALADVMSRWEEYVKGSLMQTKVSAVRRTQAVGTVAGRAYRWTANNITYKVSSMSSNNNIVGMLSHLGLLF